MASLVNKLTPVIRAVSRSNGIAVRAMSAYGQGWKTNVELATENKCSMDFYPVPEGSWQEYHSKRNSKWNIQLAASVGFCAFTFFMMYQTGVLYLHGQPNLKKAKIDV